MISWVHLSDLHFGKEKPAQKLYYRQLLHHISERIQNKGAPDFVFITGDIAYTGEKHEYDMAAEEFLFPLSTLISDISFSRIFIIPGNHDVSRDEARAVQRYGVLDIVPTFLDPTGEGVRHRKVLFSRFNAYADGDLTSQRGWIERPEGSYRVNATASGLRVGIVGLNTAWLSEGKDDRHRLTPGKHIVEEGLADIEQCDIKFVLGHHPIDWFRDEDIEAIRTLFSRHNVIYLHGHIYPPHPQCEVGAGRQFLTFQTGATAKTQAGAAWKNRCLWCSLDPASGKILVEPQIWSADTSAWQTDAEALPDLYRVEETDQWSVPIPREWNRGAAQPLASTTQESQANVYKIGGRRIQLPNGWVSLNKDYLDIFREQLDEKQATTFFDGRAPNWSEALSTKIPRREIVDRISERIFEIAQTQMISCTLITGAGGEGKSTVLRQVTADIAAREAEWSIIWHENTETIIEDRHIQQLPAIATKWLIVSDDGDLIGNTIYEIIKNLNRRARLNFHFLLCARDTDWRALNAHRHEWTNVCDYKEFPLRGLNIHDAQLIVSSWSKMEGGLRNYPALFADNVESAAKKLAEAARAERRTQHEGAFLGAMLTVRHGDGFRDHVKSLLTRLEGRQISNKQSILEAFAFIAAMHAKGLYLLSREVLAKALNIPMRQIQSRVIAPLGDEAAVALSGGHVFSRHVAIAQTATELLEEFFEFDIEQVIIDLARAASRIYIDRQIELPDAAEWRFLGGRLFKNGETSLGIRVARSLLDMDPADTYLIVHLSKLYRRSNQPKQSIRLFRDIHKDIKENRRPYFLEWGTAESKSENHCIGVWITGISLADSTDRYGVNRHQAEMSLTSIAITFYQLFELFNDKVFLRACAAATFLALTLNPAASRYLSLTAEPTAQLRAQMEAITAIQFLQQGISDAWTQRESDLQDWLPRGEDMEFSRLARLFDIYAEEE